MRSGVGNGHGRKPALGDLGPGREVKLASGCAALSLEENGGLRCDWRAVEGVLGQIAFASQCVCNAFAMRKRAVIALRRSGGSGRLRRP